MDSRCCKQRIRSQLFMGQETAENRSCRRGRWRWTPMWGRGSWRCSAGPARRSYPVRRTPSASHAGPAQAGTPHIFAVNVSFVSNTLYTVQLCVGYTERTHTVGKKWWVRSQALGQLQKLQNVRISWMKESTVRRSHHTTLHCCHMSSRSSLPLPRAAS